MQYDSENQVFTDGNLLDKNIIAIRHHKHAKYDISEISCDLDLCISWISYRNAFIVHFLQY